MTRYAVSLAILLALGACSRKAESPLDDGVEALDDFEVAGFHDVPAKPFSALACRQGTVAGLDALVCDFGTPEAWARSKRAVEEWIGAALTGTWVARDRLLLVVADRERVDPSGRTIQKVVRAFSGKE